MKIRILPVAERDLEIGADFYESQRSGLGLYFNDCLMTDIDSLCLQASMKGSLAFTAAFPNDFRLRSITTRPKTRLKSMP